MTRPDEKPVWLIDAAARLCKELDLPPTVKNMVPVEAAILSARAEQREEDAREVERAFMPAKLSEIAAAIRNGGK